MQSGLKPMTVLQSVASGLLGRASFQGGTKTAVLGTFLHFFIAFSWAAIYYVASRRLTFMVEKPVMAGMMYGEFVWIIMTFVVLPLSAIHRWPTWNKASIITGPIGHMFLVGLPIALAVKRWATAEVMQKCRNSNVRAVPRLAEESRQACDDPQPLPFTLRYSLITAKYR